MRLPFALALVGALVNAPALADERIKIPKSLFGLSLGMHLNIDQLESGDLRGIPIKKVTGFQRVLGQGMHVYFEPATTNKFFPYLEKKATPNDKHYETSFRMYLLPVIPRGIASMETLAASNFPWEIALIEWSDEQDRDKSKREEAFYWSMDVCKTFQAQIGFEPKTHKWESPQAYECTFSTDDRELKISSLAGKRFGLWYPPKLFEQKDAAVEETIRKLRAQEMLKN